MKNRFAFLLLTSLLTLGACAQTPVKQESTLKIRSCNKAEFATSRSDEAKSLFNKDEDPVFRWCEALDIPWLGSAQILRFHTPVDVDYSMTYTFIRANATARLWLIHSAEGLVVGPDPNLAENLAAFNDLLHAANPRPSDTQLSEVSNIYLFLLEHEMGSAVFIHPQHEKEHLLKLYKSSLKKRGNQRILSLLEPGGPTRYTYSRTSTGLQLESVRYPNRK